MKRDETDESRRERIMLIKESFHALQPARPVAPVMRPCRAARGVAIYEAG